MPNCSVEAYALGVEPVGTVCVFEVIVNWVDHAPPSGLCSPGIDWARTGHECPWLYYRVYNSWCEPLGALVQVPVQCARSLRVIYFFLLKG